MKNYLCLAGILMTFCLSAQTVVEKQKILYGACTKEALAAEPFHAWYKPNFEQYKPDSALAAALKKQPFSHIRIRIFFGSWCGDSKREVPRFLKLLAVIGFPEQQLELIAVGNGDSLLKQSPGHEEAGQGIFRVPTMIISRDNKEAGRINEFPVHSLEQDLLQILSGEPYSPNYRSFHPILQWMKDGRLLHENSSIRGMAEQLRPRVADEHELNSLGYLLLKQDMKKEALQVFRMNYLLFSSSSNVASSLGEGYYENKEYGKAVQFLERSLELNKDPKATREILDILYKAKEKEKNRG